MGGPKQRTEGTHLLRHQLLLCTKCALSNSRNAPTILLDEFQYDAFI